jgi:hypothetical protein
MSDLMDVLGQALSGGAVDQIAGRMNLDRETTQKAIGMALPVLISAMNRNASSPDGAAALETAVARDHDGSILDSLGSLLGGGQPGPGEAILGHVLGNRAAPVQSNIGRATGLDGQSVAQLLALLAPIVMGALGRATRQSGGRGVDDILGGAQDRLRQAGPQGADMFSQLLDANHDGSVVDDVARLGAGLLGGLLQGRGR